MTQRKPRWWARALGVVAVLALLAGAGELALRLIIPGVIEGAVRTELGLSDDHPVEVDLGGSALLGAMRGGVNDVTVAAPGVPIVEGLTADARVHVGFTPFNPTKGKLQDATAALTVPQAELGSTVELLTQGIAQTGKVSGDDLVVGRSLELFGQDVSLSASLRLGVDNGEVTVEPTGVKAAGFDLSADQLGQATGSLLDPILKPQTLCIADRLPRGVELTDIDLSSTGSVTLRAALAPTLLSDSSQQLPGRCA